MNRLLLVVAGVMVISSVFAQSSAVKSHSEVYVFRLKPHEDLKKSILKYAAEHNLKAGIVLTCVGSLEHYNLRFANQESGKQATGHFEIVSLVGTFSESGAHLHLSISDSTGQTIGGHLLDDCLIYTTAEIAIAELPSVEFVREKDSTYGYNELRVIPRRSKKP